MRLWELVAQFLLKGHLKECRHERVHTGLSVPTVGLSLCIYLYVMLGLGTEEGREEKWLDSAP